MILGVHHRKHVVLGAIFVGLGLVYLVTLFSLGSGAAPTGQDFGEPRNDGARQLRVYLEVLAIDALGDSMRLRVSVAPSPAMRGARVGSPDTDLTMQWGDPDSAQDLTFRKGEPMAATILEVDLNGGSIASYPLDRYQAGFDIRAIEANGATVPLQITEWHALPGWSPRVTQAPRDAGQSTRLHFELRRNRALAFLVLALYGEMVLLGAVALTIGCRTFLGLRPPESTLTGALTGMVFSLPVLRYALPGAAPLGIRADILVFFWAELAVALGLALFLATWARIRIKS